MNRLVVIFHPDECVVGLGTFTAPVPKWLGEAIEKLQKKKDPGTNTELIERLEHARATAAGLHSGSVKMSMSIPPQKDRDTDFIICDAIDDAIQALGGKP